VYVVSGSFEGTVVAGGFGRAGWRGRAARAESSKVGAIAALIQALLGAVAVFVPEKGR
jgi:hypothetical protein